MRLTGNRTKLRHARVVTGWWAFGALFLGLFTASGRGAEIEAIRQLYLRGDYPGAARLAETAAGERPYSEEARWWWVESLMTLGRYSNALAVATAGLESHSSSIRLRLQAREVFQFNGQAARAQTMIEEINLLASARAWAYQDAPNLVALGRAALLLGADPKRVLTLFFDRAKKADPKSRDVYLASGQLALDKEDFELASKTFAEGLKQFPDDPELQGGLARAYAPSDRKQMIASLEVALSHNTNHVPSLLLLAAHLIDGEQYAEADKILARVLAVNPWQPEAWAYRAVLAHLRNEPSAEVNHRQQGLRFWTTNPRVDHLIGLKLSQKYRFAEGAQRQKQALVYDATFLPAKIQLAQDLLRLGDENEGWRLAEQVHQADGYDIAAYNLVTLRDAMAKFQTLTNEHFILRMGAKEADIYGREALALLERAREKLSQRYGLALSRPIVVEIFPDSKDFGVRTFGIPDNPGYLGVCFGGVITANSPAAQSGQAANWQAVLWHEFTHVITLNLTHNKMPRWLSEGISVFEELQADPAWGQRMNSRYREMILGDDFVPISELSAAFLAPKSGTHLQFAYFEAALLVQFLAERFGFPVLREVLGDLGDGRQIQQALAARAAPLESLEKEFKAYARRAAEQLAPGLDFSKPRPAMAPVVTDWIAENSKNFYHLTERTRDLVTDKKWREALAPLQLLLTNYPSNIEPGNPYKLLAITHRGLGQTNEERRILTQLAALDADDTETFQRLMELDSVAGDWPAVARNAERYLAVNPLVPLPYRHLAQAAEQLNDPGRALRAWRVLVQLDPPDPAEAHFRLAKLLYETDEASARRHVLQALEEAPRYREALRLLLQIHHRGTNRSAVFIRQPSTP